MSLNGLVASISWCTRNFFWIKLLIDYRNQSVLTAKVGHHLDSNTIEPTAQGLRQDIRHECEFHAAALHLIAVSLTVSLNPLRKSTNKDKIKGSLVAMHRYAATGR